MKLIKTISSSAAILVAALFSVPNLLHAKEVSQKYAPLHYPPRGLHGQALVDMELAKHPELKILVLHTTLPGISVESDKDRCIFFSNIGRIGKPDIDEDAAIFRSRKESTEAQAKPGPDVVPWSITSAPKFEVMAILYDRSGKAIGLAGIIFPYKDGEDTSKYVKIAREIEADLKERIESREQLFEPASSPS